MFPRKHGAWPLVMKLISGSRFFVFVVRSVGFPVGFPVGSVRFCVRFLRLLFWLAGLPWGVRGPVLVGFAGGSAVWVRRSVGFPLVR